MAKKKVGRKKARAKKLRPLDAELFELAEKVALVFDRPEAAHMRARLFHEASAYRNRYRPDGPEDLWATKAKWIAFLLRLILTCPHILSRPPDFEWVVDDLEWCLTRRKWHPGYDRDFWDAVDRLRAPIRTGHPRNKALDYFRFETVNSLRNPPEQLKGLVKTCRKEESLRLTADMEEELLGKRPDKGVVRRSFDRVTQELEELHGLLRDQPSLTPPPTNQPNGESEKPAKKTSNRRRQSTRPRRVRRK